MFTIVMISFAIIYFSILYPNFPILIYCKLKVGKEILAGIFISLGISAFANKIDYILYWNVAEIIHWKFSIIFAIINIIVGLWLYSSKEK